MKEENLLRFRTETKTKGMSVQLEIDVQNKRFRYNMHPWEEKPSDIFINQAQMGKLVHELSLKEYQQVEKF